MVYSEWVENLRSPILTDFIQFLPYLARSSFIFFLMALGYWQGKHRRFFVHFGLFLMISGMVNLILKGYFEHPRPPEFLHLVTVVDALSFPSGDAQLAVVLWGMLALHFHSTPFRVIAVIIIVLVMFSRVYLGVHYPEDVLFGAFVGAVLLAVYKHAWTMAWLHKLEQGRDRWGYPLLVIALTGFYALVEDGQWVAIVPMLLGSMTGFGFSLPNIRRALHRSPPAAPLLLQIVVKALSLMFVMWISRWHSSATIVSEQDFIILFVRYLAVTWCVFSGLPSVHRRLYAAYAGLKKRDR